MANLKQIRPVYLVDVGGITRVCGAVDTAVNAAAEIACVVDLEDRRHLAIKTQEKLRDCGWMRTEMGGFEITISKKTLL